MPEHRVDAVEVEVDGLGPDADGANAPSLATLLTGNGALVGRRLSTDALRAIRAHLGMEVAFISEFVGDERVFRVVDSESPACPVQVGSRGPLRDSYCQRVVDGRLPSSSTTPPPCPPQRSSR